MPSTRSPAMSRHGAAPVNHQEVVASPYPSPAVAVTLVPGRPRRSYRRRWRADRRATRHAASSRPPSFRLPRQPALADSPRRSTHVYTSCRVVYGAPSHPITFFDAPSGIVGALLALLASARVPASSPIGVTLADRHRHRNAIMMMILQHRGRACKEASARGKRSSGLPAGFRPS